MTSVKVDFDSKKALDRDRKKLGVSRMKLMNEIVKDTTPFVPMQEGNLFKSAIINLRRFKDKIVWNGPYARFLYQGFVMIGVRSRKAWANEGEVKEVTKKAIKYGKIHPMAGKEWYIRSKAKNKGKWVKFAKKVFKNG